MYCTEVLDRLRRNVLKKIERVVQSLIFKVDTFRPLGTDQFAKSQEFSNV